MQKTWLVHVYVTCTVSAETEQEAREKLRQAKDITGIKSNGDIFIIAALHGDERLTEL